MLGGEQAQFSDLPNMGAQERTELLDMLRSWNGSLGEKICYGARWIEQEKLLGLQDLGKCVPMHKAVRERVAHLVAVFVEFVRLFLLENRGMSIEAPQLPALYVGQSG